MFKMLPQTDTQFSKVDVKDGKWFLCAICDIHVNNRDDRDFIIGQWGDHKRRGGHRKALSNKISIAEPKKREKAGDILNKKEKKYLNFGKKGNTSLLTDFSQKTVRTVEMAPRHPLLLESSIVQMKKQI